jgi:hypothetical protein
MATTSRRAFLALLTLPLAATAVAAAFRPKEERPYALIFVTVWTPDKHPAGGVKLKIRRTDGKKGKWDGVSDRNGEYAQRVPAGAAEYLVTADIKSKGPKPEAKIKVTNDERVDLSLHLTE